MKREYNFLTIQQNNTTFYVVSIDYFTLSKICSTSIKNIEKNVGSSTDIYQRSLNQTRIKQISDFVNRERGIMPPAIVLNSLKPVEFIDGKLIIDDEKDQFFIIDGQHRIAGVRESQRKVFNFPVVIMNNVEQSFQDELFVSINNEQKRVNPIIRFRIKANSYAMTPEKAVFKMALFFNTFDSSPFVNMIKMNDEPTKNNGLTKISISTFASILLSYIYDERDYYEIKEKLISSGCTNEINGELSNYDNKYQQKILWKLYRSDNYKAIIKILYNYFSALRKIFVYSWGNDNFITTKTTGFNAFMLLFKDVFNECYQNNRNFSYDFIFNMLSSLAKFDQTMLVSAYGLGKIGSLYLYREFYKTVFKKNSENDFYRINEINDDE